MNIIQDTTVPVVVLKAEHYSGLGIMRSIGRLGVKVYGIETNSLSPALWSRYCTKRFVYDMKNSSDESLLKYLESITRYACPTPVLIPTSDETMMFVAEHAGTLKKWYRFPEQSSELIHSLYNKKQMYALAKEFGIPVPKTCFPQSMGDVVGFAASADFPVLIKGIDGKELEMKTGRKMVIVKNSVELLRAYILMEDFHKPNVMLQEYIVGPDENSWVFNGYFNKSSLPLITFTGRKIRQNPIYTGMTSLGITQENGAVVSHAIRFMQLIGYHGVVDIDFRYDARDGEYKILDINPRVGASFRMFVGSNGMDVVRAMYLDLTHQHIDPTVQLEQRKWLVEDKDLLSSFRYFKDGALSFRQWFKSIQGIGETGYFALDDILPFLLMCKNHINRQFSKLLMDKKNNEKKSGSFHSVPLQKNSNGQTRKFAEETLNV